MENILNGLNKVALLADLYKDKSLLGKVFKSREKRFAKALELKTNNRINNSPHVTIRGSYPPHPKTKELYNKEFENDLNNGLGISTVGPYNSRPVGNNNSHIHIPRIKPEIHKSLSEIHGANKARSEIDKNILHNSFINHELDEAHLMKYPSKSHLFDGYKNEKKQIHIKQQSDELDFHKGMAEMGITPDQYSEHTKELVGSLKRRILKPYQTAAHQGPEILLHESNRSFHEATPKVREHLMNLRKHTGELDYMRRNLGVRYGEEYIPPNGRKWNSIIKNSNKDVDKYTGFIELDRKLKQKNEYLKNRNS